MKPTYPPNFYDCGLFWSGYEEAKKAFREIPLLASPLKGMVKLIASGEIAKSNLVLTAFNEQGAVSPVELVRAYYDSARDLSGFLAITPSRPEIDLPQDAAMHKFLELSYRLKSGIWTAHKAIFDPSDREQGMMTVCHSPRTWRIDKESLNDFGKMLKGIRV